MRGVNGDHSLPSLLMSTGGRKMEYIGERTGVVRQGPHQAQVAPSREQNWRAWPPSNGHMEEGGKGEWSQEFALGRLASNGKSRG